MATASIGQVHRARLPGGERVVASIYKPAGGAAFMGYAFVTSFVG